MKFKTKLIEERFKLCHKKLQEIAEDLDHLCDEAGEELVITESFTTKAEDDKVKRQSSTHREGRAIDIRVKDFDSIFLNELIYYANTRYKPYGAVSSDGTRKLVVYGDKRHLDHIHLQLNRSFTMPEIKDDN